MNDDESEAEIKIEYYESIEVDPLSEHNDYFVSKDTDDSKGILDEILNETEVLSPVSPRNDENNEPIEPEHDVKWYKSVDTFGKYQCKFCELSYSTVQTLRNHVRLKHSQNYQELKNITINSLRKQKLKCHVCKKKFKNTTDFKNHIEEHGLNNIQKSCMQCHAVFDDHIAMITHMKSEHNTIKQKLHFCTICGYNTSKLSHFKQHENTHSSNNKSKCSYCDYSTNYLPNLKIHERIHSNVKPYVCDFKGCDYRCAAKSALYSHQLKHDKEKNMLHCDKCTYSTVYKQSLKKHIDSHNRNSVRKRF
ncbi:zinc finger Y-chromosomal protein-like [Anticarsia gemmatalis]|uniref:zinc finger Y-chromosomal protein-like n=1 Tax=Anticarsia gemmatalis TaxID=129554 RepID=UPI003F758776